MGLRDHRRGQDGFINRSLWSPQLTCDTCRLQLNESGPASHGPTLSSSQPPAPTNGLCVCLADFLQEHLSLSNVSFIIAAKYLNTTHWTPSVTAPHRCQGPASPGLWRNSLAKALCQTTGQIKSKRALAPRGKMHISFDLLHGAHLQERKQRLLSLQGAMKNELGPLLREGMEENLSFRDVVLSHLARRK